MPNRLAWQREYRRRTGNIHTRRYEKTPKGFLMRLYRNMQSRVSGIQPRNRRLYFGKPILDRGAFYEWALSHPDFWRLFEAWVQAGYPRKLAPTVNRIDAGQGYELSNMEWMTHSENSRLGGLACHAA